MMPLHCHNEVAKRRSIALNLLSAVRTAVIEEAADLVAVDFNGTSWRQKVGDEQRTDSTIEQALSNNTGPLPPGPQSRRGPRATPDERTGVRGPLSPSGFQKEWVISKHGAFAIDREEFGMSSRDQTWIHLGPVNTPRVPAQRDNSRPASIKAPKAQRALTVVVVHGCCVTSWCLVDVKCANKSVVLQHILPRVAFFHQKGPKQT